MTRSSAGIRVGAFPHEHDCPASDEALAELFARHGIDPLRGT
jgi:hypothetical protein